MEEKYSKCLQEIETLRKEQYRILCENKNLEFRLSQQESGKENQEYSDFLRKDYFKHENASEVVPFCVSKTNANSPRGKFSILSLKIRNIKNKSNKKLRLSENCQYDSCRRNSIKT